MYFHQCHGTGTLYLHFSTAEGSPPLMLGKRKVNIDPGQFLCMVLTGAEAGQLAVC